MLLRYPSSTDWSVCPGASPGATASQLPHGALVVSTHFTSLATHHHNRLNGTERIQYEVHLLSGGLLQVGWCAAKSSLAFTENDGVGDVPLSVAIDGSRGMLWSIDGQSIPSFHWSAGDVISCYADLRTGVFDFCLNGTQIATFSPSPAATAHDSSTLHGGERVVYVPALSIGPSEACVVNTGECALRYPKRGYTTLRNLVAFREHLAHDRPQAAGTSEEAVAPVPLGLSDVRCLVRHLGFDEARPTAVRETDTSSNDDGADIAALAVHADDALTFLEGVLQNCGGDVFDVVMCAVQWWQADTTGRWQALVMVLYFWVSRLYVASGGQEESARRVVSATDAIKQRVQQVFDLLDMLLPADRFHTLPGLLLTVFQHRLADRSAARKVMFQVACDLVRVPSFRRHWVRDDTLFTSTLLNLFQPFPISAADTRWVAQQLEQRTLDEVLRLHSTTPTPVAKTSLQLQARAFECVETLLGDGECHAPMVVALSSLLLDSTLRKDDISCSLLARLGCYHHSLPVMFAVSSPAVAMGSVSWAVAAALGKLLEDDAARVDTSAHEPHALNGLVFRPLVLKWLPPEAFYGASSAARRSARIGVVPTVTAAPAPERADLRVGGAFVAVQQQLLAEAVKAFPHSTAPPPTAIPVHLPEQVPCVASSRSARIRGGRHSEAEDGPLGSGDDHDNDDDDDDEEDDEGPALGSVAVSRCSRVGPSAVRGQRGTAPTFTVSHSLPCPTSPRWDEMKWRRQSARFAEGCVARSECVRSRPTDGASRVARTNAEAHTSSSPGGRALHDEAACCADLLCTAVTFIHTFTRHPTALLGSLELLYNLADQYLAARDDGVAVGSARSQRPQGVCSVPTSTHSRTNTGESASSARSGRSTASDTHTVESAADVALRELCAMLRRVETSRHWDATSGQLRCFAAGLWRIVAYYWSRMSLFERRLLSGAAAQLPSADVALTTSMDEVEAVHCPPRAFLMLPVEVIELGAEVSVYAAAFEQTEDAASSRSAAVMMPLWDAQLRRAVSPSSTRALLYRTSASLFATTASTRQALSQCLQSQKQAHEAYLDQRSLTQRALLLEDPFSLYEASFLDSLDAYTAQEDFNEASALNLLFSMRLESCLIPPPHLFEESSWWVRALRTCGDHGAGESARLRDHERGMEADALTFHAAVSASLKSDHVVESTLACMSKCNQLLTQFSALLPATPSSLRHTDEVKSFQAKYVLLLKSLHVLDFLVRVLGAATDSSSHRRLRTPTAQQSLDPLRVSLMDLLTQCVVRLGGAAQEKSAVVHHPPSVASRISQLSGASVTTNALTDSACTPSVRTSSTSARVSASVVSSNVLQPALCRDAEGWWSCTSADCTVTGLLAPVFSMLSFITVEHGKDVQKNPFFRVATGTDVLVQHSLAQLRHHSWWTRSSGTSRSSSWCHEEAVPKKSQDILRVLQQNLREVERSLHNARAGVKDDPQTSRLTPVPVERIPEADDVCLICRDAFADTRFEPCGHTCCSSCFSRYQSTLTVRAASSAHRSAPSSQSRHQDPHSQCENSQLDLLDTECLTLTTRLSSSRVSLSEVVAKCFFCQQHIQGTIQRSA